MGIRNIIIHALGGYTAEEWQAQLTRDRGVREHEARGTLERSLLLYCTRCVDTKSNIEQFKEEIACDIGRMALERGCIEFAADNNSIQGRMVVVPNRR